MGQEYACKIRRRVRTSIWAPHLDFILRVTTYAIVGGRTLLFGNSKGEGAIYHDLALVNYETFRALGAEENIPRFRQRIGRPLSATSLRSYLVVMWMLYKATQTAAR